MIQIYKTKEKSPVIVELRRHTQPQTPSYEFMLLETHLFTTYSIYQETNIRCLSLVFCRNLESNILYVQENLFALMYFFGFHPIHPSILLMPRSQFKTDVFPGTLRAVLEHFRGGLCRAPYGSRAILGHGRDPSSF